MIVYWVSRKPSGSTYSQKGSPSEPSPKPELLLVPKKTKSADWWLSGAKIRMATTIAAPATCHQTLTFCSSEISLWL
ncbi:hypothetical protein GCM10020220_051390 [Nonomuraea rubra]